MLNLFENYLPIPFTNNYILHYMKTRDYYLRTVFIDTGGLPIVQPCIIKHQPDIVTVLPRIRVLPCV